MKAKFWKKTSYEKNKKHELPIVATAPLKRLTPILVIASVVRSKRVSYELWM